MSAVSEFQIAGAIRYKHKYSNEHIEQLTTCTKPIDHHHHHRSTTIILTAVFQGNLGHQSPWFSFSTYSGK